MNGRVLLGMVGYDSMAAAMFEALKAELSLRTMRLQHHVREIDNNCVMDATIVDRPTRPFMRRRQRKCDGDDR